jgi:fatty acid desaturase
VSNSTLAWYRSPIERSTLRTLTRKSNFRGFLQTFGHLLLLAATASAAYLSVRRLPVAITVLIMFLHGTFYAFLLNGFHELCHRTVFRTRFLNELFLRVFSFLGWYNFVQFRASHRRHHLYTLHPPEDLEVVLPIKFTLKDFLLRAFINPLGVFELPRQTFKTAIGRVEGEWPQKLFPVDDLDARRRLAQWARILLVGHIVSTVVFVSLGLWMVPLLTTFAPFYGSWLLYLCNNTQHVGLKDNVSDFRLAARTFELNPFVRFLYWQMNYHIEHHMYAAVPCYRLKKLHKLIEHELPPTPRGFVQVWTQIISILRRQKKEPTYQYDSLAAVG